MDVYKESALQQRLAQCQRQLQASERRFRNIIEKNADGILIVDQQGLIRFANPAAEEILGRTVADLVDTMFGFPVVAAKTTELDIIAQGQVRAIVEMRVMETEWEGDVAYVASLRDITERKKNEEALKLAKEEAEAANRAKGNFLANMSHELRTPLNAILGYAQILQREHPLTEKQQRGLTIIKQNGEHLLTLLNDILDISKIETEKIDMHWHAFDLRKAMKSVIEITRFQAQDKGIGFSYEQDENLPEAMYGDEKRLRQILLNLLGNAVKFTKQGTIRFRVSVRTDIPKDSSTQKKSVIRFEVQDTGIGISAEHLQSLGLPFAQIKDEHSSYEGMGLGLALSRRVIQKMGSELRMTSTPGKGSTFWFDLAFPEALATPLTSTYTNDRHESQEHHSLSSERIIGYQGKLRRILLADHNASCRKRVKDMLLPVGFEIFEAIHGQDALNKTQVYHPDVIVIDVDLPLVDGFEVVHRIRQIEGDQETVILAISASPLAQDDHDRLAAECHGFLTKPISELRLFDTLQTTLNITWLYEDKQDRFDRVNDRSLLTRKENEAEVQYCQHRAIPSQKVIRSLYDLAMIGDVLAVRERIEDIDRQDPEYALFVSTVRKPAQALNMVELQRVLQQYLEQKAT